MNIVRMYGLGQKEETQIISIPKNAKVLSVCVIHERLKVAVEEDVNAIAFPTLKENLRDVEFAVFNEKRHFDVDDYQFLGTVVLNWGNTIYHVFYRNV